MPDPDESTNRPGSPSVDQAPTRRLRVWQMAALAASVALMVAGLAWHAVTTVSGDAAAPAVAGENPLAPALTENSPGIDGQPEATHEDAAASAWAPIVFRLGFSFFMGFVIATALRAFLRITLVACGLAGLLLFGLEYGGFIEVQWTLLGDQFDGFGNWLAAQTRSFAAFVGGSLPSAGLLGLGFLIGFRRG